MSVAPLERISMDESVFLTENQLAAKARYEELERTSIERYKFIRVKHMDTLSHEFLFISDPTEFNDPFDLKIEISDETILSPFDNRSSLREAFKVLLESSTDVGSHWMYDQNLLRSLQAWISGDLPSGYVVSAVNSRLRKFGIACFTPEWDMPLMWSHYGDMHKGLCVQYFVRKIELAMDGDFFALDTEYTSALPKICLSEVLFSPHKTLPRLLATKHINWAYEKEWRLVHVDKKGQEVAMPKGMQLGALIIGKDAPQPQRVRILERGRELKIPVHQIKQRFGTYDLYRETTWPM